MCITVFDGFVFGDMIFRVPATGTAPKIISPNLGKLQIVGEESMRRWSSTDTQTPLISRPVKLASVHTHALCVCVHNYVSRNKMSADVKGHQTHTLHYFQK